MGKIADELNGIQLLNSQDPENYYIGLIGLRHLGWSPFSLSREFICSRKRLGINPINKVEFEFDTDNKFLMYNMLTNKYRLGWDKHHITTIDGVEERKIICIDKLVSAKNDMDTEAAFASFLRKVFKNKKL